MNPPQTISGQNTNYGRGTQGYVFQIVLLLLIGGLVFWFLVRPKMVEISNQKEKVAALSETKAKSEQTLQTLERLVSVMNSKPEELKRLDEVLPLEGRTTKLNVMIERYVQNAGMSLANIAVDVPGEKDIVAAGDLASLEKPFSSARVQKIAEISIIVTGTMQQFEGLLKTFETSSRLIDTEAIEIQSGDNGLIQFRLKVKSYFYQ